MTEPPASKFRLEYLVGAAIVAVLLVTGLLIWRGGRGELAVVELQPLPGDPAAPAGQPLRVRFDQPLIADSQALTLTLIPPASGQVHVEGDAVIFTPDRPLAPDTQYTAQLAAGVTGQQGQRLARPITWRFHTSRPHLVYEGVDNQGRAQLFTAPMGSPAAAPAARQLTDAEFGVSGFDVAPDGNTAVYAAPNSDGSLDIWRVDLVTGGSDLLLECPQAMCTNPAWSPDGKLLAVSARVGDATTPMLTAPAHLWLLDMETGENTQVFPDEQTYSFGARWSDDGQWLSYDMLDQSQVGVYNVEDGRLNRFSSTTREGGAWRPGHRELVISREAALAPFTEVHLFLVDPVAGDKLDLSLGEQPVADGHAAWSPDGEWLALRRSVLTPDLSNIGVHQIWRLAADGSQAQPLTGAPEFDHGAPVWSPDGRYLAYHRVPMGGSIASSELWVMDVASGDAWKVAAGQAPQWGP